MFDLLLHPHTRWCRGFQQKIRSVKPSGETPTSFFYLQIFRKNIDYWVLVQLDSTLDTRDPPNSNSVYLILHNLFTEAETKSSGNDCTTSTIALPQDAVVRTAVVGANLTIAV